MQNKFKATTALLISAAGAVFTYPAISPIVNSVSSFTLGLLNHGFTAATIGGLADWFGVTALFRKPLGIGYHTQILISNRQRIMEAIVDFVSNDLLSVQNINYTLKNENTANLLISYFEQSDGRSKIKNLVNDLFFEIATTTNTKEVAKSAEPIVKNQAKNIDAVQIINTITDVLTNDTHSRKIIATLFEAGLDIFKSAPVQNAILVNIAALKKEYEGDSAGRAFVLSAIDLTDDKILDMLNNNIDKKVNATIKTLTGNGTVEPDALTTAANLSMYFKNFIKSATSDSNTQKFIDNFKSVLSSNFDLKDYIKRWLDSYLKGETFIKNKQKIEQLNANANAQSSRIIKLDKVKPVWQDAVDNLIDEKIDTFINSPILQDKFDRFIKNMLNSLITNYHDTIPMLIREKLDSLSDEQLVTFVEEKVADDLQMIRINGSICGGFVGVVLYIIAYFVTLGIKS